MKKTWLIFKNELINTVARRSFIITLLLVPVIAGITMLVISALGENTDEAVSSIFAPSVDFKPQGYIDQSGLLQELPADVSPDTLIAFEDEQQARQALANGEIGSFFIIDENYVETGKVVAITNDFNPVTGLDNSGLIGYALNYNLIGRDQTLLERMVQPLKLDVEVQAPDSERDGDNMLSFWLPYAVTMLFYIIILSAAGFMLNSITAEKQNRMLEILMVSVTPIQMLTGKIIALGLVGLLQTVVWSGTGFLFLRLSGQSLNIPASFQLPVSILAWGVVFFILGYAVYASFMAGVGALVPSLREASQATTVMVVPMVIPLMFLSGIVEAPNGTIATVLSLFPLTSPVAMMARLSAGNIPILHPIIAAGLLLLTAALVIRGVASLFRAQTLLSGQPFTLGRFFQAMRGKKA